MVERDDGRIASSLGDGQVIEVRLCVGLAPEPDHSRVGEGRVLGFQELLAIEVAGDGRTGHGGPDGVPLAVAGDLGGGELGSLTVFDLVEPKVVLERVVAAD